jgi:hypothetical protein
MLRAAHLPRSQPALNLLLITKRWQKIPVSPSSATTVSAASTPGSNTTQYATSNPPSTYKTQTASTNPSFNAPIDRTNNPLKTTTTPPSTIPPSSSRTGPLPPPPPPFSTPSSRGSGGSSGMVKTIIYGVTLGLTATLVYAEYENGSFRHQLESNIPFSSTILGGLDQVIDPVFGRQKKLTTTISQKLPDLSYVKDKLPDKNQLKKLGEQVKDATSNAVDKLPDKAQIKKTAENAKDAVSKAYDQAADQVKVLFLTKCEKKHKRRIFLLLGQRCSKYCS